MFGLSEYVWNQLFLAGSLFADLLLIGIVFGFCRWIQKKPLSFLGFTGKNIVTEYFCGALSGSLLFGIAFLICYLSDTVRMNGISGDAHKELLVLFLLGYMVQGMAEEILCRGYIMGFIREYFSVVPAILINSVIFAAIHLANPGISALALVNLFLFGVFASLFYLDRGSLWGAGAFHAFWNFVQGNIFGISVSGNEKACSLLDCSLSEKGSLLNGGAFGLEGGLAVTIVMLIGIIFLLYRNLPKLRNHNAAIPKHDVSERCN